MTQSPPSTTPETAEAPKRGPGRPPKDKTIDLDMPEGIRLRAVYLIHACTGDRLDAWISHVDWATVLPTNHACGSFDWIVLVGGHTVVAKKLGRKLHVPWSACKNGIELDAPLTEDELKRAAQ